MKITDLITELENQIERGYKYISTDELGFTSTKFSTKEIEGIGDEYYIVLLSEKMNSDNPPKNPKEGKDYSYIKCKVLHHSFEKDKEGRLDCVFSLKPIDKLPSWYNLEYGSDDFNDVSISKLVDNTFWINYENFL